MFPKGVGTFYLVSFLCHDGIDIRFSDMLLTYQVALRHNVDDHSLNLHQHVHLKSHCPVFLEPFSVLLAVLTGGGARARRWQLETSAGVDVGTTTLLFWILAPGNFVIVIVSEDPVAYCFRVELSLEAAGSFG